MSIELILSLAISGVAALFFFFKYNNRYFRKISELDELYFLLLLLHASLCSAYFLHEVNEWTYYWQTYPPRIRGYYYDYYVPFPSTMIPAYIACVCALVASLMLTLIRWEFSSSFKRSSSIETAVLKERL